jgi:putative peptidoglycan lipid II flippase
MVIAHVFGASVSTDAFLIAFKIPNFMRRLFAEGAFSQAFIPILSEYKTQRDAATIKQLIDRVAGNLGSILLVVTLLGILGAPLLVLIFAPGFIQYQDKYQLTVAMLQITFPYLLFITLTALAGAILNTYGRFAIPALTPVVLNLVLIAVTIGLASYFKPPIMALAWGVLLAGMVQLSLQLPFLYRLHLLPKPQFNWHDEGVKRILHLMLPALFGVSVSQINLLIDTLMASFLVTGSVSWLYYSDRIMEFPVGVFGLALATVMLPNLSKSVARQDMSTYNRTLDWALRWVVIIAMPAMIGLITLAQPILITLFYRGAFSESDVIMTTQSLTAYAVGLVGFVLIKVLASGFYSRQDTRTPVKIAVIAMITNISFNLMFIWHLQHAGLALATSLAALLNAGLLYHGLRHQDAFQPLVGWKPFLLRVSLASTSMAIFLWWSKGTLTVWLEWDILTRVGYLFSLIGGSMLIYFISLVLIGFRLHHINLNLTEN